MPKKTDRYHEKLDAIIEVIATLVATHQTILDQQEDIIEKLANISTDGEGFGMEMVN